MTRRILAHWFTGCLLALTGAAAAKAQMQDAFVEPDIGHDMQLFAPVDFDFEGMPLQESSGWFFNYERVNWCATGERTVIGQEGLTDEAETIVRQNPLDDLPDNIPPIDELGGNAPQPYTVINGIQDGGPDANFAWGDRYEFGYFSGGNGWLVGVLDGPISTTNKAYGFPELAVSNNLPISQYFPGPSFGDPNFNFPNPLTITDGTNANYTNRAVLDGSGAITTTQNGFGSVHVNFDTPAGYLFGRRDYYVNGDNNLPGPTSGGPSYIVTQVTRGANGLITTINVVRGADGQIDDLDGDLINGFGFITVPDPAGGDDIVIATFADFDDLHKYNIRFDRFYTRNTTETRGVELMRTHDLDNSYMPKREQSNHFAIAYGARLLELRDAFSWEGQGDLLGRSYAVTDVDNQIIGPQVRAKWTHQRGRWGFDLDGRFLAGANIQDIGQTGGIGENLNPGGMNSLLFAQPTYFNYGRQANFFTPVGELRAEASYQITSAFALKLGYTGIYADNITRSSQIVNYSLPDMGFRTNQIGRQEILVNGVNFGVEAVY